MTVETELNRLVGELCTDFRLTAGGLLSLKLGAWTLWIESAWRLDGPSGPLVGSLDVPANADDKAGPLTLSEVLARFREVVGQTVAAVRPNAPVIDVTVLFSGGYALSTFSHSVAGESWALSCTDGQRLAMTVLTEYESATSEDPDGQA